MEDIQQQALSCVGGIVPFSGKSCINGRQGLPPLRMS